MLDKTRLDGKWLLLKTLKQQIDCNYIAHSNMVIIDIVNISINKASTDLINIDMPQIRKVIERIADPLTHLCNLSFLSQVALMK